MSRLIHALALALVGGGAAAAAGHSAHAATRLCVGSKPGCFPTLQAAVNAASDGDTITIAPGTFAGGVTINVSVAIQGAGASATTIKGGGPVLLIGQEQATSEPTVSIQGVTIRGGFNNSSPDQAVTQGGGVEIAVGSFPARGGLGATVTISDSVITGNQVASEQLLPPSFCGGPFDCSFATGGGIANAGTLTLINTRVTDNQAGDPSSKTVVATGGGIAGAPQATLTLKHCLVTGNRATGTPPHGDTAHGGGIDAPGPLTIEDSVVSGNSADLSTQDPTDEFPLAIAGGIGIGANATITRTIVSDNGVTATNVGGQSLAVAGGIFDEGSLTLSNSTIARNNVSSNIPAASHDTALAGSGGMEVNGAATIRESLFVGNSVEASAAGGIVHAGGGGIGNFGQTTIDRTGVIGNHVTVSGAAGSAQGGGIDNDTLFGSTPSLTITNSVITGNSLSASSGLAVQGGGLFTAFPMTLTRTNNAGNSPDQCFGC
jgi:hypothetical protein